MSLGLHNLTVWFDRQWTEEVGEFIRSQSIPVNEPGLICGYPDQTMVSYASQKNYLSLVEMLCNELDADVNAPDSDSLSWNALLWACHLGHQDMVKLLCEKCNANVSYRDSTAGGKTAIQIARLAGQHEIVEFLETFAPKENADTAKPSTTDEESRPIQATKEKNTQHNHCQAKFREYADTIAKLEQRVEDIRSMYHQVVKQKDMYEQANIAMQSSIEVLQLENESLRALRDKERTREVLFSPSARESLSQKDLEDLRKLHNDLTSQNNRLKQEVEVLHSKLNNEEKIRQEYEKQLRETQEQVLQLRAAQKTDDKPKESSHETQVSRRPFFSPSRKEIARKLQSLSKPIERPEDMSSYNLTSTAGSDSLERYETDSKTDSDSVEMQTDDSKEDNAEEVEEVSSRGRGLESSGEVLAHWDWKCDESEEDNNHEVSTEESVESREESIDESFEDHEVCQTQEPFGKRLLSLFGKRDEAPIVAVQSKPWFWQKHQQLPADDW